MKDRPVVELVDLPCFGRPARLVWHKHRWRCPAVGCPVGSWTGQDPTIAAARLAMTDRAGRWATTQVGRHGLTVNEVAGDLGCDWHTVNDAVMAYGTPLVEGANRIGQVRAVGHDEVLFARQGGWRTQVWSTSIADVATGQPLDVIDGRSAAGACAWFADQPAGWCEQIAWAVLDLSGPWRLTFDTMLPWATQVADPFHLVKLANQRLDDVRRRRLVAFYDHCDRSGVAELERLARTIGRWETPILRWHHTGLTNAATEGTNLVITDVKWLGFGFRYFENYRLRLLLRCGAPWHTRPVASIRPRQPRIRA